MKDQFYDPAELPTCAWQALEEGIPCGEKATFILKDGGAVYCDNHALCFGKEHLRPYLPRDYPNGVIDARRRGRVIEPIRDQATGEVVAEVERADRSHVEQLRQEIKNIIERYGQESDLNYVETFGVLEMCKLDFAERIRQSGNQDETEEPGRYEG